MAIKNDPKRVQFSRVLVGESFRKCVKLDRFESDDVEQCREDEFTSYEGGWPFHGAY